MVDAPGLRTSPTVPHLLVSDPKRDTQETGFPQLGDQIKAAAWSSLGSSALHPWKMKALVMNHLGIPILDVIQAIIS